MGRSTYGYDGPGNLLSNTDSDNNVANVEYNTTAPQHRRDREELD